MNSDNFYMSRALELAEKAAEKGEAPIGAVIVRNSDGKIVGEGKNSRESAKTALGHAEIEAISEACSVLGGWRLSGCTLYVTLEPCPMCAGAAANARIDRIVFGAGDKGAIPYKPEITSGVMCGDCETVLKKFFRSIRSRNKMNDIKLIEVKTDEQIAVLAKIADEVWHEFFPSVLSAEQIDYMVEKFQSAPAMTKQINEDGYEYYYIHRNGVHMGYVSIHREEERLFLSKLYLKKEYRGKGYASQTFSLLKEYCREHDLRSIWLTVNKYNAGAIAVYEKTGFIRTGDGVTDIGNGFFMDDYFYEMQI